MKILHTGSEEAVSSLLREFNAKHSQSFQFPDFTSDSKQHFFEALFDRLNRKQSSQVYEVVLKSVRILSREKSGLEIISTESTIKTLLNHAGLITPSNEVNSGTIQDFVVIVEAQKCLCNIIFNNSTAQRICSTNCCIEGIIHRLKTYKDPTLIPEIKFFDMRMLFVLTALCTEVRPKIRQDLHGFTYLIEVLDLTLRANDESERPLNDSDIDLSCEVLKILFNLTVSTNNSSLDEEEEAHYMRLVSVLHDLLVCETVSKEKRHELHNHTVNLLTNMPRESFEELLTPLNEAVADRKSVV